MTDYYVTYVRNPDFIFRQIVEEMILVPIVQDVVNMDYVFALNDVGATIWQQLETPQTRENLTQAVLSEYNAESEVIKADLEKFLRELLEIGAIKEVE